MRAERRHLVVDVVVVGVDVAPVEDGVLGRADVDEGRLHARQDVLDLAQVDVAVDLVGVVGRSGHVVLDERPALEDGDLGGLGPDVDGHHVAADGPALALPAPPPLEGLLVELDRVLGVADATPGRRTGRAPAPATPLAPPLGGRRRGAATGAAAGRGLAPASAGGRPVAAGAAACPDRRPPSSAWRSVVPVGAVGVRRRRTIRRRPRGGCRRSRGGPAGSAPWRPRRPSPVPPPAGVDRRGARGPTLPRRIGQVGQALGGAGGVAGVGAPPPPGAARVGRGWPAVGGGGLAGAGGRTRPPGAPPAAAGPAVAGGRSPSRRRPPGGLRETRRQRRVWWREQAEGRGPPGGRGEVRTWERSLLHAHAAGRAWRPSRAAGQGPSARRSARSIVGGRPARPGIPGGGLTGSSAGRASQGVPGPVGVDCWGGGACRGARETLASSSWIRGHR